MSSSHVINQSCVEEEFKLRCGGLSHFDGTLQRPYKGFEMNKYCNKDRQIGVCDLFISKLALSSRHHLIESYSLKAGFQ